LIGGTSNS